MKRNVVALSTMLVLMLILSGCAKRASFGPPPPPPPESILGGGDDDSLKNSLFKGDQSVLSDQDIARILGTQLKLSDRRRLAILSLSSSNWWSQDIADLEAKNFDALVKTLKSSA